MNYHSPSQEDADSKRLWKRSGACLRCGKCCLSVVTTLKYVPELDDYLTWMGNHLGVEVTRNTDSGLVYIEFKNKCRCLHLGKRESECKVYHLDRPAICVNFPSNPNSGASCHGYTFEAIPADGTTPEVQKLDDPSKETRPQTGKKEQLWDRSGECVRCGKCCNSIVTMLSYKPELRDYFEWLSLHRGVVVMRDKSTGIVWVEFRNRCKHLRFKRDKALCRIYEDRPKVCREFPLNPMVGKNCSSYVFKVHVNPATAP